VPLPTPATRAGADGLRALLARPGDALVGLDFDGTLSPIVADPGLARPAVGAVELVRRLAGVVGTVAIVTGRPALMAAALLGLDADAPANLIVLGHYGLQRWTAADGLATVASPHPRLPSDGRTIVRGVPGRRSPFRLTSIIRMADTGGASGPTPFS
jgi:trehalose 6-phosphate phosphatase